MFTRFFSKNHRIAKAAPYFFVFLVFLLHHCGLWAMMAMDGNLQWPGVLEQWDSGWYVKLASEGYGQWDSNLWAFFPLFPGIISLFPSSVWGPGQIGFILSILCFLGVLCFWLFSEQRPAFLFPRKPLGLAFFLFSPASYIFHTNHTESLFLLLSFGAFYAATRNKLILAALLGGLCALTRNQGVFVPLAIGIYFLSRDWELHRNHAVKAFLCVGAVSGALWSLFPIFQYLETERVFLHVSAQSNWNRASSMLEVLRSLWLGNPWQNVNSGSLARHVWFFVLTGFSIGVLRKQLWLGVYCLFSLLVISFQGEYVNAFRFSAVLFPVYFYMADYFENKPIWARLMVLVVLFYFNHNLALDFPRGRWSY